MEPARLFLLGDVRLEVAGQSASVDTRKALALAAYLAVTGRSQSRDVLATMFWPESDQASSRGALRRTLSALRKALHDAGLYAERDLVSLDYTDSVWVDAVEFRRNLAEITAEHHSPGPLSPDCRQKLLAAINLYRGDFMEGFSLRDSLMFDDWQFQQSEAFRSELASALSLLIDDSIISQNFESALEPARRWLSLDPLNEAAHRRLIELYDWSGMRTAAMRQYQECMRVLDAELGVPPLEETTRLYEAIRHEEHPPPLPGVGLPDPAVLLSAPSVAAELMPAGVRLPMVGRAAELAALQEHYLSCHSSGRIVVLAGEPGIGKTRLADEFITWVHAQGGRVLVARCYEGENNLAYGVVVEALRSGLEQHPPAGWDADLFAFELAEAARLLPELGVLLPEMPTLQPLDGPGAQARLYEGIFRVLLALAYSPQASPSVIFLDDLQWADSASLDWLAYAARRLGDRSLLLLATWSADKPSQDENLRSLLSVPTRQGSGYSVPLLRLTSPQIQELLETARQAGWKLPPEWLPRLETETEGVPFFLVAYLHALQEGLAAQDQADGNLANQPEAGWTPAGVQALLQARLARLSDTARQLLQTAAVIGRSFEFDIVQDAAGRTELETVLALEELATRGLVRETRLAGGAFSQPIQYDFNHELMRLVVYTGLSMARQRLLHRRIAESFIRKVPVQDRPAYAGQVAFHYRQAGETTLAAGYYRQAGVFARGLFANTEAQAHFEAALALGDPDRGGLYQDLGDLQTLQGDYSSALQSYQTAAALLETRRLPAIYRRLGQVYERLGEWENASEFYQAGLATLDESPDPHLYAHLLADWSLTCHRKGDAARAGELANQALTLAKQVGDPQTLAQVHNLLGVLARHQERAADARRHLEQSLAFSEQSGSPTARVAALNNLALVLGDQGELTDAIATAEQALVLCEAQGDRHREAAVRNNLADLFQIVGQHEVALAQLKQSVRLFAEIGVGVKEWQPEIWKLVEW